MPKRTSFAIQKHVRQRTWLFLLIHLAQHVSMAYCVINLDLTIDMKVGQPHVCCSSGRWHSAGWQSSTLLYNIKLVWACWPLGLIMQRADRWYTVSIQWYITDTVKCSVYEVATVLHWFSTILCWQWGRIIFYDQSLCALVMQFPMCFTSKGWIQYSGMVCCCSCTECDWGRGGRCGCCTRTMAPPGPYRVDVNKKFLLSTLYLWIP